MADYPERLAALQPFWGAWYLDAMLGEGSYGKVYRIYREEFGERYEAALKWMSLPYQQSELLSLRSSGLDDEGIRRYYEDRVKDMQSEIKLMSNLRGSSHIVSFEDHIFIPRQKEIGWDILIRMELLKSLPQRMLEGMTVGDVVRMGIDLCDALTLCAKNHIVHRDIKPDNIFISKFGDYKLGDFGVAREMRNELTNMSMLGTPVYMAPEVYRNDMGDQSVDQYSLGLVMHRMLNAQQLPFAPTYDRVLTHPEREEAFMQRMKGTPVPPPLQGSEKLKQAICRACSYQAKKRFPSPEAFRRALEEALNDPECQEPLVNIGAAKINSVRSSLHPQTMVPAKKKRWPKVAAIGGAAWLAALVGVALMLASQRNGQPSDEPANPETTATATAVGQTGVTEAPALTEPWEGWARVDGQNTMLYSSYLTESILHALARDEVVLVTGQQEYAGRLWCIVQLGDEWGYVPEANLKAMTAEEATAYALSLLTPSPTLTPAPSPTPTPTPSPTPTATPSPTPTATPSPTPTPTPSPTPTATPSPTPTATPSPTPTATPSPTPTATPVAAVTVEPGFAPLDFAALDAMDLKAQSDIIYQYNLGEFYEYYSAAKAETGNTDMRMALMAIAEAKLLESGVITPLVGDGIAFAMGRVVPHSVTTASWGVDAYKWHTMLVTNELIKTADRDALTALWNTSADHDDWIGAAKAYLANNGYTLNDTYNMLTGSWLQQWDILATNKTADTRFTACTYSGLLEYDAKNVLQPALATDYEVSEDGLTYTFHIREGVRWVDYLGRDICEVTAYDWVAAMQHIADIDSDLSLLLTRSDGCGIKNFDAYFNGDITDFSLVGVTAVDDYTLMYTLEEPFPAFLSLMSYNCFAPLCLEYYESMGGWLGAENANDFCLYGTAPEYLAYCGPYTITGYTDQNSVSYAANPAYWNRRAVNVQNVNVYYNGGRDYLLRPYNETVAGTISDCTLTNQALLMAQTDIPENQTESYFDLYQYTTEKGAASYVSWMNLNRHAFANFDDPSVGVSEQTPEMAARTRAAMNNRHFRLALAYAFDRASWNAFSVGEELKYASLRNSYTPGTFLQLGSDVTVRINGEAKTYPAGTYYGAILQDQLVADGSPIVAWDPAADSGVGSGDGFDGWYNVENARAELALAVAELAAQGIEVSPENPICIDVPYPSYNDVWTSRVSAYKQSIENTLEGVTVNMVAYSDSISLNNAHYRIRTGAEANYDVDITGTGWGPDYGDAQSYLDTLQPSGAMVKQMGLD